MQRTPQQILSEKLSSYSGYMKLKRLNYIRKASKFPYEAAKFLVKEMKNSINTDFYKSEIENLQKEYPGDPNFLMDIEWLQKTELNAQKQLESLEAELNSFRANMLRDSIRTSYNKLGEFHLKRGDLQNALTCFGSTRDYNTTAVHSLEMCLNIVKVSLLTGNYVIAQQYINRGEEILRDPALAMKPEDMDAMRSKFRIAAGLCELDSKKYKMVAKRFTQEVNASMENSFSELITMEDVAIIGGICALATFERDELKNLMSANTNFKFFLEMVPEIGDLIDSFANSKYDQLMSLLMHFYQLMSIDSTFGPYAEEIFSKIRHKALIQYVLPFLSVDIQKMAKVFGIPNVMVLEKELEQLIVDKQIKGKIDSHNKVLYAKVEEKRDIVLNELIDVSTQFNKDTQFDIIRMNMSKHNFSVKSPQQKMKKGAAVGMPMGLGMGLGMGEGPSDLGPMV